MKIDITCPNCNEHLVIEVAPTTQEVDQSYADAIDRICESAWRIATEYVF